MEKLITARYAGHCTICKLQIPAGSRAIWLGSKRGMRHESCGKSEPTKAPNKQTSNTTFTVDFIDLKKAYLDLTLRGIKPFSSRNEYFNQYFTERVNSSFHGATNHEMNGWLENGYRVPGLDISVPLITSRPRRKTRFADEGDELLIDLAIAGIDEPFLVTEKVHRKPGLKVEIHAAFAAGTNVETIQKFYVWLARSFMVLDSNAIDTEIKIVSVSRGLWTGDNSLLTTTEVRVKQFNESMDFANWSPIFSPGGYRHLIFMAKGFTCDTNGRAMTHHIGHPQGYDSFDVKYNDETNTMIVEAPKMPDDFPEFIMTEKFRAVIERVGG